MRRSILRSAPAFLASALLLVAIPAAAQGTPRPGGPGGVPSLPTAIRGMVVDASSSRPLNSATVSVWSVNDESLVTGTLTRPDGSFRVEGIMPGRYRVRVTSVGYATFNSEAVAVTPASPVADLGIIRIAVEAVAIEGLTVEGERAQAVLTADRNTYQVRDMPATAGGSAVDVLRNVPAIEVDIDGRVSMRGSDNVAVQINGRPAPMRGDQLAMFLQQLPANMVERVEVIPNPSARFDPDGMAGIVNIVLRQNTDLGASGGLTMGAGTNGRINASGNAGYQAGPWSLFGSYGFLTDDRRTDAYNFRENRFLDPMTILQQDTDGRMNPMSHNLNANAEYRLTPQNSLAGSFMFSQRGVETHNRNDYLTMNAGRDVLSRHLRLADTENSGGTVDGSLGFRRVVQRSAHELNAELRVNRSTSDVENVNSMQAVELDGTPNGALPSYERTALDAVNHSLTAQLDYMRPVAEGLRLETGYKGTLRLLDHDFTAARRAPGEQQWATDLDRSNAFDYEEQVHAGYAVLNAVRGQYQLQGGLRLEQAATRFDLAAGDSYDNDYFSFFPSGLLAYNLTESTQLKASYSKRIQRPNTQLLNPFVFSEDPLNLFVGNPYLGPEYTHAFELGYQTRGALGTFQLTPFFRRTVDAVRRVKTVDDEGVAITTFANFATSDSYGGDATMSFRFGPLNGFAGVNAYRVVTDGSNVESSLASDAFGWTSRSSLSYRVNPRLDLQGFLMYRAPMQVEQGRVSGMTMMHLGARQKVFGERGNLSLRVTDPFGLMGFSFITEDDRHYQESRRSFGMRGVYLGLSLNVGRPPRMQQRPQQPDGEMQAPETGIQ
jgi:outer membrane receptor protein involved in Fe transport